MATTQAPDIGSRIREARGETSQVEFAKQLDFSERAVQAWERNERTPRLPALTRIAQHTGRSVAWFYEGSEEAA